PKALGSLQTLSKAEQHCRCLPLSSYITSASNIYSFLSLFIHFYGCLPSVANHLILIHGRFWLLLKVKCVFFVAKENKNMHLLYQSFKLNKACIEFQIFIFS